MDSERTTAADKLDLIRDGATQLVLAAQRRIQEASELLTEGRFSEAFQRLQEASGRVGPLASAEDHIATWGKSYLLRAHEVEEGMVLRHWGRVIAVEHDEQDCAGAERPHVAVKLKFEGHTDDAEPHVMPGDAEVLAVREP